MPKSASCAVRPAKAPRRRELRREGPCPIAGASHDLGDEDGRRAGPCKGWPAATACGGSGLDKVPPADPAGRQEVQGKEWANTGTVIAPTEGNTSRTTVTHLSGLFCNPAIRWTSIWSP